MNPAVPETTLMSPEQVDAYFAVRAKASAFLATCMLELRPSIGDHAGSVAAMAMLTVLVEVARDSLTAAPDRMLVLSQRMHSVVDVALGNMAVEERGEGCSHA